MAFSASWSVIRELDMGDRGPRNSALVLCKEAGSRCTNKLFVVGISRASACNSKPERYNHSAC